MRILQGMALAGAVVLGALGMAGAAQARDNVYWSLGVGAPGVALGVGNAPPVVYAPPPPVYVAPPRPVYVAPPPAYFAPPPPAYFAPPPVAYRPAPVYAPGYYYGPPGHYKHRKWRGRHHRDWD